MMYYIVTSCLVVNGFGQADDREDMLYFYDMRDLLQGNGKGGHDKKAELIETYSRLGTDGEALVLRLLSDDEKAPPADGPNTPDCLDFEVRYIVCVFF